ncbi:MAG: 1-deoxy-D-xylulose-5-phosphate reductoisomerase, partial [Alistipes sp.]|nr:1-deoxy-D-xylulose-5-phosphate reductoisomerase [Alistipes sp.]
MNGANEVAVAAFLDHKCSYPQIVGAIEYALERAQRVEHPTLDEYADSNIESRRLAAEYLNL